MGKSGHVGLKVAATLSSTGTPAYFVHPSEASHGDLGMITRDDAILAFSWSGETVELGNIVSHSRRFAVPLIAVTSNPDSTLAQAAEVVLALPHAKEACPHGLAPTTSTVMQLALGDCIAIALLESKGFTAIDFKALHPGGQLGAKLKFVSDLMHKGDRLPLTPADAVMSEAIVVMTEKALGCLGVVDGNGLLRGIITDGDLRRNMGNGLLDRRAGEIMTPGPKTVTPDLMASAALEIINASAITALFVVENGRPVGHHPHSRPAPRRRRLGGSLRRHPSLRAGERPSRIGHAARLRVDLAAIERATRVVIMHRHLDRVDEQDMRLAPSRAQHARKLPPVPRPQALRPLHNRNSRLTRRRTAHS